MQSFFDTEKNIEYILAAYLSTCIWGMLWRRCFTFKICVYYWVKTKQKEG